MALQNKGSIFTSVPKKRQSRSNFNLSHDVKLSLDMGNLIPTYLQEVLPGDKISISTSSMFRLAPLISPVMHKINVYQEYFFVPNRIMWPNWETFITGSRNGKQLQADEIPAFPVVGPWLKTEIDRHYIMPIGTSSLADYFGLPTSDQFPDMTELYKISALPFMAYQKIWDEYYRDENLVESMFEKETQNDDLEFVNYNQLPDGFVGKTMQNRLGQLRRRAWEHDYFTSALPWAQKGEEVTIPTDIYMKEGLVDDPRAKYYSTIVRKTYPDDDDITDGDNLIFNESAESSELGTIQTPGVNTGDNNLTFDSTKNYANASTINDLRAAIKLQEWLETNARGGSRYFESIYAHFGVQSPDSRLQRPEFIGSHRSNMIISEVLQSSSPQEQEEVDSPLGTMAGHGQSVGSTKNFHYTAQEHGYIIGLTSVMPNTAYQQGVPKTFLKTNDRLEFYFPEFAHLGEQEVLNIEIYAQYEDGDPGYDPYGTFGYVPRYSEYKFQNSRVAGDFRDTLNFWHMGRTFGNPPKLNEDFIQSDPTKRIFAVQGSPRGREPRGIKDYDSIYAHIFHDVKASRLMPKYGTPSI